MARLTWTAPPAGRRSALLLSLPLVLAACAGGDSGGPTDPDPRAAARIEVTPGADTLAFGAAVSLQATVFDGQGSPIAGAAVSWSSSAPGVVAVDGQGRAEARGVGVATVTATSGQASDETRLTVEAAEHLLTPSSTEAMPFGIVVITLPDAASPLQGTRVMGTLGADTVAFTVLEPRSVGFVVPELPAGSHSARIELTPNEVGIFPFTVVPAAAIGEPGVVIESVATSVETALDGLTGAGAADGSAAALARSVLDAFRAGVQAMSAAERIELAQILAANAEAFAILDVPEVPAAAARSGAAATAPPTPADLVALEEQVRAVARKQRIRELLLRNCQIEQERPHCMAQQAELATRAANLSLTKRLLIWLGEQLRVRDTRDGKGSAPFRTKYTSMGVRGVSGRGSSVGRPLPAEGGDLRFDAGTTYALELDLELRTPMAEDAASGPLAPLGRAMAQVTNIWLDLAAGTADLESFFGLDLVFTEPAPTFRSPPLAEIGTVKGPELALARVSDPEVACEGSVEQGEFLVRCTTEAIAERAFTLSVGYVSPWDPTTYELAAVVRPVLELVRVSGEAQTGYRETALAEPLVVAVRDATGEPVAGVTVRWTVASGGGSLTASESVTDAAGQARTRWTLGAAGDQAVEASAGEAGAVTMTGSPVRFTAAFGLATYEGPLSYSGTETVVNDQGISCTWHGTVEGVVTIAEISGDSVTIHASGTGNWPEGESNTEGVTCRAESGPVTWEGRAALDAGTFSTTGEGWTLSGTISGDTVTGSFTVSETEEGVDYTGVESGSGSFTATRVAEG